MIAPHGHPDDESREIARGLATAVQAAVDSMREPPSDARTLAWNAAVDVAELLDLEGLVVLLAACESHQGAPPLAVAHVLERITRLSQESVVRGDLSPFVQADRELAALAGTLSSQDWSRPVHAESAPEAVQSVAELLVDFQLDHAEVIAHAQVTLSVAAGLRAALDWIGADLGGGLHVSVHDAALTLAARAGHEPGLGPAGALLALSGGALLPEDDGRWALRVPLHAERPAYLLVRQGELSLALPWHAVARLRIADDAQRAVMTEPSLPLWEPLARSHGERPAALLALGLTRAWLHLDHIVWRVFADPQPALPSDAVPGGRYVVRTEEGGEYWVVEVGEALRGVPPLHTPAPRPRPRVAAPAATPAPVAAPASHAEAYAGPVAASEALADAPPGAQEVEELPSSERAPSAPMVLGAEDVRPLGRTSHAPLASAPAAELRQPALLAPEPEPAASAVRFALVVDDSLVARLTLGRALERAGWMVEWVEHAGEMWEALSGSTWSVVFVDVSLPDASGRAHLRQLVAHQVAASTRFEVVALTRDAGEERLALECGITRTLRKPFAQSALDDLVSELPGPSADA